MPTHRPESEDDDIKAPDALVAALKEVHRERIFVPEPVDAAILRRARRRLSRRPSRWLAAAAAVVLAGLFGWMQFGRVPTPSRMDVNADGRVDIRDALALARRAASGSASSDWDMNGDGIVDRRDAEVIARHAVSVRNGGT